MSAANLGKARVAQQFAASELRRVTALHSQKLVSDQDLENAQLRDASSAKDIASAEGEVRQMEAVLADFGAETNQVRSPTEIKAPISGRVLRVQEESAKVVSAGAPLMELGDPLDLEVVIEVLSRDGAIIAPGARVELDQWGGPVPLNARVRLVEPSAFTKVSALGVEEQRVNVIADIVDAPAQRSQLGDHFRVEARIVTWEEPRAIKAPAGACFRRGGQWSCFVVAEERARLRPIKVGRSSGTEIQILEGLREGEEVILYPSDRVQDGLRIKAIKL
jgi:HlyD family secretion protein